MTLLGTVGLIFVGICLGIGFVVVNFIAIARKVRW